MSMNPPDYVHTALVYRTDSELLDTVVPFAQDALAADEPVVAAFGDGTTAMLREALGEQNGLIYFAGSMSGLRPATSLRNFRSLFEQLLADGAPSFRAVGEVPHPGIGSAWDPWFRYEAAATRVLEDLAGWSMCCYDERSTPDEVLDDVALTHPYLTAPGSSPQANERFEPAERLVSSRPAPLDPLEEHPPALELLDPTPAAARRAVAQLAEGTGIDPSDVADFLVAASEAVTNATLHGRAPVELQAWSTRDRLVVCVRDRGAGPVNPLAGLDPVRRATLGGFGLWLIEQLCSQVGYRYDEHGFTVRLTAGGPPQP
jgi:anti-sigma regulatory factor (Ser/Thr protein kinase)